MRKSLIGIIAGIGLLTTGVANYYFHLRENLTEIEERENELDRVNLSMSYKFPFVPSREITDRELRVIKKVLNRYPTHLKEIDKLILYDNGVSLEKARGFPKSISTMEMLRKLGRHPSEGAILWTQLEKKYGIYSFEFDQSN